MSALFLADPQKAREALQLAVRLSRTQAAALTLPPAPAGMTRDRAGGGGAAAGAGSALEGRLRELDALVARGVLSEEEKRQVLVGVLVAQADPLPRLAEAWELMRAGKIAEGQFAALKRALLQQVEAGIQA